MLETLSPNPYPKIDLVSPDLYMPLWRPDMVARGGRIVNGTGVCTGSPLHLVVGANTVAVTSLGTFTVYMPEGGSVASDTTTVSGSPVTISAGIATTITTTGATGNITVTSNNIIRSKDKSNRALTITGAAWGSQGRTFDGVDDDIDTGYKVNTASALTLIGWAKVDVKTGDRFFIGGTVNPGANFGIEGSGKYFLNWGGTLRYAVAASAITVDRWFHWCYQSAGGATGTAYLYIDLVQADSFAYIGGATDTRNTLIGSGWTIGGAKNYQMDGIVGEACIYTRDFTNVERAEHKQRTQWRYV